MRASKNCRPPEVAITPEYPLYIDKPDINIERDEPIEFSVSITIDCDSFTHIDQQWNIFFCETIGQKCVPDDFLNNFMLTLPSQNTSDIYIPPFSLKPGYYHIECNVTIFPYGLHGSASSFIRIVPSLARIYFVENRLIQLTIYRNEALKLEPWKYSIDREIYSM